MSAGQSMDRRMNEPGMTGRTSQPSEENKNTLRRSLDEVWGKYNTNAVDQYYAANFVDHTPAPGFSPNRDGIKKAVEVYRKAFPNGHLTIGDVLSEGDEVAARFTFHGKHTGELQGIPPTNKEVTLTGLTICRIQNGKVVESWESIDQLQLMQQLGVVQPPGQGLR